MDGFLYSFLEAVPKLLVLRHLLQLGVRLLVLRLLVLLIWIQKIHLLNRQPQHLILSLCQQPEFHLQLAHPILFSFPPSPQNVLQSDSLRLFCVTAAIAGQRECLEHSVSLQDEIKTGLKLQFECWVKFRQSRVSTSFSLNFTTRLCCTLGSHGPYRVSQNYNRHPCEPFCSCTHRFS